MKKCDLCHKSDKLHYRVKSKIYKDWFFVVKNVGLLFLNIMTILMVGQESQIDKESSELNYRINQISRSLKFKRNRLNRGLTNNYGLQRCFIKFTKKDY